MCVSMIASSTYPLADPYQTLFSPIEELTSCGYSLEDSSMELLYKSYVIGETEQWWCRILKRGLQMTKCDPDTLRNHYIVVASLLSGVA